MAITSIKTGSSFTNLQKYDNFLGPNAAYNPSSYESIATVTAAGGETSLSFTSIPSTYASLQIRALVRTLRALDGSDSLLITLNSDTGANYSRHRITGDGTTAAAGESTSNVSMSIVNSGTVNDSALANTFAANLIDIHDYASTTKNKTMRAFSGANANSASTSFVMGLFSSGWYNTAAVTTITFTNSFGFKAGSVFSLYGIKGA